MKVETGWDEVPSELRRRLEGEGIDSPQAWLALSTRQRANIFGITPHAITILNAAARASLQPRGCENCDE